jgi:hypothetical protein
MPAERLVHEIKGAINLMSPEGCLDARPPWHERRLGGLAAKRLNRAACSGGWPIWALSSGRSPGGRLGWCGLADEGSASRPPAARSSASQAVKAPSILLNRATHLIPTTFRHQTP